MTGDPPGDQPKEKDQLKDTAEAAASKVEVDTKKITKKELVAVGEVFKKEKVQKETQALLVLGMSPQDAAAKVADAAEKRANYMKQYAHVDGDLELRNHFREIARAQYDKNIDHAEEERLAGLKLEQMVADMTPEQKERYDSIPLFDDGWGEATNLIKLRFLTDDYYKLVYTTQEESKDDAARTRGTAEVNAAKANIEGSISALQLTLYQKMFWQDKQSKCEQQLLDCDDPQKKKQLEQELETCKKNVADPFPGGSKLLATIQNKNKKKEPTKDDAAKDGEAKCNASECTCSFPEDTKLSPYKSDTENMKAAIKGIAHYIDSYINAKLELHEKAILDLNDTVFKLAGEFNHLKIKHDNLQSMVELMTRQPSRLVSICIHIAFQCKIPTDSSRDSGVKTRSQLRSINPGTEFCVTVPLDAKASVLLIFVEGKTGVAKDALVLYKKDKVTLLDLETPVSQCGTTVVAKLKGGLAGGAKAKPNKPNPKKTKKDKKKRAGTFALFTQGTQGDVEIATSVYELTDRRLGMRMFWAIYKGGEENELNLYFNHGDVVQQNRIVELQLSIVNEIFGGSRYALSEEEIQTNYLRFFEIDEET